MNIPDLLWTFFPGIADLMMAFFCVIDGLVQGLIRGFAPIEQVPGLLDQANTIWEILFT